MDQLICLKTLVMYFELKFLNFISRARDFFLDNCACVVGMGSFIWPKNINVTVSRKKMSGRDFIFFSKS